MIIKRENISDEVKERVVEAVLVFLEEEFVEGTSDLLSERAYEFFEEIIEELHELEVIEEE